MALCGAVLVLTKHLGQARQSKKSTATGTMPANAATVKAKGTPMTPAKGKPAAEKDVTPTPDHGK